MIGQKVRATVVSPFVQAARQAEAVLAMVPDALAAN